LINILPQLKSVVVCNFQKTICLQINNKSLICAKKGVSMEARAYRRGYVVQSEAEEKVPTTKQELAELTQAIDSIQTHKGVINQETAPQHIQTLRQALYLLEHLYFKNSSNTRMLDQGMAVFLDATVIYGPALSYALLASMPVAGSLGFLLLPAIFAASFETAGNYNNQAISFLESTSEEDVVMHLGKEDAPVQVPLSQLRFIEWNDEVGYSLRTSQVVKEDLKFREALVNLMEACGNKLNREFLSVTGVKTWLLEAVNGRLTLEVFYPTAEKQKAESKRVNLSSHSGIRQILAAAPDATRDSKADSKTPSNEQAGLQPKVNANPRDLYDLYTRNFPKFDMERKPETVNECKDAFEKFLLRDLQERERKPESCNRPDQQRRFIESIPSRKENLKHYLAAACAGAVDHTTLGFHHGFALDVAESFGSGAIYKLINSPGAHPEAVKALLKVPGFWNFDKVCPNSYKAILQCRLKAEVFRAIYEVYAFYKQEGWLSTRGPSPRDLILTRDAFVRVLENCQREYGDNSLDKLLSDARKFNQGETGRQWLYYKLFRAIRPEVDLIVDQHEKRSTHNEIMNTVSRTLVTPGRRIR
jgi:hypothetical protein